MTQFPSFDPGTPGTLLDASEAKKVKHFIEAWNSARVILSDRNQVSISDTNVVIELDVSEITRLIDILLADVTAASSLANDAMLAANTAQSTADSAQSTADDALSAAGDAQNAAAAAQNAADEANDYLNGVTEVSVGTCDPGGTINVLTR